MREGRVFESPSNRHGPCAGRLICLIVFCLLVVSRYAARATGGMVGENAEHDALGIDAPSALLVFDRPVGSGKGTRFDIETGKRRLFGIEGLTADGVRLSVRGKRWGVTTTTALLSAPVGYEGLVRVALLCPFLRPLRIAPGLRLESVSFGGFQRSYVLSASVRVFARVCDRLLVGSAAEGMRIDGERGGGADVVCRVVAFPESPVCGLARLSVSRHGNVGFGVSSRIRVSGALVVCFGYEDDTGMLKGSVAIRVGGVRVNVGASIHPVLGVSESLFVAWRR